VTVSTERSEGILTIRLDDGAKNALTPTVFRDLIAALGDDAAADAVVLTGRDDILTAGLDVKWMAANGRDGVTQLLVDFGRCLMRWWTDPRPTVCAASGHAIAAGSMLAMACDHAVATETGWWGLTETQIDFEMPRFGIALAHANLRSDRLEDLILPGARVDAATAVAVGFADELVADGEALERATAHARQLAALPARAYAGTKQRLRADAAAQVLDGLEADIVALTSHLD
jgi:enoyl-CoA hydratase